MAGQCDLMILNPTSKYNSLCIEFKSPTGSYHISEKQLHMKKMYEKNFVLRQKHGVQFLPPVCERFLKAVVNNGNE